MILNKHLSIRRAFYPACARDIIEPRKMLKGIVDEIIFCDIKRYPVWSMKSNHTDLPRAKFVVQDARELIPQLEPIDVLFYRGDSFEGGSHINILGQKWLDAIMSHFPPEGGLIITDGSNSRGHIYKKMLRTNGYTRNKLALHFQLLTEQPFLEDHGLHTISVTPSNSS